MSFPQPGTLYRIQSIDFDTCLHVWDISKNVAVLRPLKETNLQQWLFIKESGPDGRYKIMAAATQSLRSPRYLTLKEAGGATYPRSAAPPVVGPIAPASIWEISKENDGSYVLTTSGKNAGYEAFLRVSETGMLDSVEREVSNDPSQNCSERWQILEYWPAVPRDTYRIRTLNGGALEINPNLDGLSWLIEPKGNGNCTISLNNNGKEKDFLGWERGKDGFAQIAVSKTSFEWFIRSLGEYTRSAEAVAKDSSQSKEGKPNFYSRDSLIAHNQIWFLERVHATDALPPYSLTARYPEMVERDYAVRNIGTARYLFFYANPSHLGSSTIGKSVQTRIRYVNGGNTFMLSQYSTEQVVRLSGNGTEVVSGLASGTLWVLERSNDPNGGYLY
ncbi:hypothetical protein H0H92_015933 [Tricholoma furcatifolium]|nr:hypothetical protein H0H92_015933 [Tricholoma furcatifolium]